MKLFYTPTSPFVRKVTVAARELGLDGRLELVTLRPSPLQADATLSTHNPLNKIPALVLDDGTTLYDSRVICDYLDTLHAGRKLVPASGAERFTVLRRQALSDGILEAGVFVFYERANRPAAQQWEPAMAGQAEKARQALDALEREANSFGDGVDLGLISIGATLGWLEFRAPFGDVRAGRPQLFGWYDSFRKRPSMVATEPKA